MFFRNPLAPDDETVKARIKTWEDIFKQYENCRDERDEGYDLDTMVAIAEAEDSDDFADDDRMEEDIDPNEEAIEEINFDESDNEKLSTLSQAEKYEKFTLYFSSDFVEKVAKEYRERTAELAKKNLPYWNM